MKKKLITIFTLTGFMFFALTANIFAQYNFVGVTDNAVLGWGEPNEWDDGHVWNPSVIKDGDTLKMWYTGGSEIIWDDPITFIGYAWSLDGVKWIRCPSNPVLAAREEYRAFGCAVIKDTIYKMWYGECAMGGWDLPWRIAYATSEDGINWNKESSYGLKIVVGEWDDFGIVPQTVIKTGEGYRMYYWASRTGFPFDEAVPKIGMATSVDGISWTKYNDPSTTEPPYEKSDPVFKLGPEGAWDSQRVINPMVVKLRNGYHMFYAGLGAGEYIGYAKSSNGIDWTRHPNPVLPQDQVWGSTCYGGTVLAFGNYFHMWYALFHVSGQSRESAAPRIGYATSANPLGVNVPEKIIGFKTYPNPFSSSTTINFELRHPENIQIEIYDYLGKLIEVFEGENSKGKQQIIWNAEGLSEGIYFCKVKTESSTQTMKMIKVK